MHRNKPTAQSAGRKGGRAAQAKRSAAEKSAMGRHAVLAMHAKRKAKKAWVLDYVDDQDKYLSEEEFNAL